MSDAVRAELLAKSCVDVPKGSPAISAAEVERLCRAIPEWGVEGVALAREYKLPSYMAGVRWCALLAAIADAENHHPEIRLTWRRVKVLVWTHTVQGLSENDFILAAKLDRGWEEFVKQEAQRAGS